ncbi:hypothetical protein COHA_009246 [Chlorella ohadii]|uniref:Uncharacterized protein n=1 Tax=Chlorella ohadii TaxID=2649997 RepID=A0AAD5GYA3_9CHLO|nr:hypothetical protein COHA_009246 [Chlorella ohadii]
MQPDAAGDGGASAVAAGWAGDGAFEPEHAGSPQPLSARHRTSLDRSPWADLQPEMLAVVLAQAGHSSSLARTAAAAGAAGEHGSDEAARYWRKAAKLGHPEGQWKLGWAHYKGLMGLAADGEEALLWLSRAARQLAEVVGDSADGGSSGSASGSGGGRLTDGGRSSGSGRLGATAAGAGRRPLPALMSESQCKLILSQAAHVLGLLYLDGEGTKADLGIALKWLRLAERQGCREVSRVIGSLLNVGMYG